MFRVLLPSGCNSLQKGSPHFPTAPVKDFRNLQPVIFSSQRDANPNWYVSQSLEALAVPRPGQKVPDRSAPNPPQPVKDGNGQAQYTSGQWALWNHNAAVNPPSQQLAGRWGSQCVIREFLQSRIGTKKVLFRPLFLSCFFF